MLYRSPKTRWALALVGLVAGLVCTFGDAQQWRSTPSLHWLDRCPLIPLQFWGVAFVIYAVLLLASTRTRPYAFAMGAFLFSVFLVSLIATMNDGKPKNIFALAAMFDVVVFHLYSIRTAETLKLTEPPRARKP